MLAAMSILKRILSPRRLDVPPSEEHVMKKKPAAAEPLRGEDAYLAAKAAVAKRNDAARTRLEGERSAHNERRALERKRQERLEAGVRPEAGPES
jgi:hypothetical protein